MPIIRKMDKDYVLKVGLSVSLGSGKLNLFQLTRLYLRRYCSLSACVLSLFSCVGLFMALWTVARLLCPRDSPGKNTGMGCHALVQGSSRSRDQTLLSCTAGGLFILSHWENPQSAVQFFLPQVNAVLTNALPKMLQNRINMRCLITGMV